MIINVYSVLDRVTGIYGQPLFLARSAFGGHVEAVRWFSNSVAGVAEASKGNRVPADFALYYIGSFDSVEGKLIGVAPEFLSSQVMEEVKELVEKSQGELEV